MYNISFLDHPDRIREITEEEMLIEIALHSVNPAHRMVALEKINDESILNIIADTDPSFMCRRNALRAIKDENILAKYLNAKDSRLRAIAIGKIHSQERIEFILLNENDSDMRYNVLKYYTRNNSGVLSALVLRDDDPRIRQESLNRVKDPNILIRVSLSDEIEEIRHIAIEKLKNNCILTDRKNYHSTVQNI